MEFRMSLLLGVGLVSWTVSVRVPARAQTYLYENAKKNPPTGATQPRFIKG